MSNDKPPSQKPPAPPPVPASGNFSESNKGTPSFDITRNFTPPPAPPAPRPSDKK